MKDLRKGLLLAVMITVIFGCNEVKADEKPQAPAVSELEVYQQEQDANKELVAEFVEAMRVSNVEKLKTMITDDFSWWIIGKPEYLKTGGEHDRDYFLGFFKGADLFPEGADFRTTSMISELN